MKLYTLGLYEKSMPNELSFREKLTYAREAGYDFLEMSIDETEEKLARLDWSVESGPLSYRICTRRGFRSGPCV